jgi:hypothetical protein
MTLSHQAAVQRWLDAHPGFRLATDDDCACPDDIASVRSGFAGLAAPVPAYHPYYAHGDFNSDTHEDFAVVVLDRTRSIPTLLVFNGPAFGAPAFVDNTHRGGALFFGPPRPQPYRLLIGTFYSEGTVLEPVAESYRWDYTDDLDG